MSERLCHKYGPGRLPYASRRDIGAGIAMAATGGLSLIIWFGGAALLFALGIGDENLGFVFGLSLFAAPVAIPAAFLVGTLLWRQWPPKRKHRRYGALFGAITALCSLITGALGPASFFALASVIGGEMVVTEGVVFFVVMIVFGVPFALIAVGWLVVPLGAFGGWYHERAKLTS